MGMDRAVDPWEFEVWTEGTIYRERTLEAARYVAEQCERDGTRFCLVRRSVPFWEEGGIFLVIAGDATMLGEE
jgi:hypothetical protein